MFKRHRSLIRRASKFLSRKDAKHTARKKRVRPSRRLFSERLEQRELLTSFAPSGDYLAVTVASSSVNAGAAFSVAVTALDPAGNTVNGYSDTIRFSSSDDQAALPGD